MNFNIHFMLIVFSLLLCFTTPGEAAFNGTCELKDAISKQAYTHWPFSVNCDSLKSIWRQTAQHNANEELLQCIVTQDGFVITNTSIVSTSLSTNTNYTAKLIINNTICLENEVRIHLLPFPEGFCNATVREAKKNNEIIHLESTSGDPVKLYCRAPDGSPEIIASGADKSEFRAIWYTNCEDKYYNSRWDEFEDPGYPSGLSITGVNFYDAADFTCAVTYGHRTLYAVTYSQCIKQRTTAVAPTITCTTTEIETLGSTGELDCEGQLVYGITHSEDFVVEWKRDGKVICTNNFFNRRTRGYNPRQSCIVQGNNDSIVCEVEVVKDEDVQPERKELEIKLNIGNLDYNDFGEYSVKLQYFDKLSNSWKNDTQKIQLEVDNTPALYRLITILSISLGVLIFVIILLLLLKKFELHILLTCKKWLWAYDKNDRQYICYLSYLYNEDNTLSNESRKATRSIVDVIYGLLNDLNYDYYDEQRQGNFEARVERVCDIVERCHRMVFVLTPEYLKDEWSKFDSEIGFNVLLENKTSPIFIVTPGTIKELRRLARTDNVLKKLSIAIKTIRPIKWKERMSDEELRRNIEYRLPKINRSSLIP